MKIWTSESEIKLVFSLEKKIHNPITGINNYIIPYFTQ
jgi:hypothetical protein